jgi:predicted kinase
MREPGTPMLIVFGGVPGTGKTTIARELSRRLGASYVRIDTIEQSLRAAGLSVGPTGYVIGNAIATENLKLGRIVVADCVNPVLASRIGWRETASGNAARLVEIETICSDADEHRRRVEGRASDIDGLVVPSWQDVVTRTYEPWDRERIVLDTAIGSIDQLVDRIVTLVTDVRSGKMSA